MGKFNITGRGLSFTAGWDKIKYKFPLISEFSVSNAYTFNIEGGGSVWKKRRISVDVKGVGNASFVSSSGYSHNQWVISSIYQVGFSYDGINVPLSSLFVLYQWKSDFYPGYFMNMGYILTGHSLSFKGGVTMRRWVRYPTPNDLFWEKGGNPYLNPEIINSYSLFVNLSYCKDRGFLDLMTRFFYDVSNNHIIWMPVGAIWKASNLPFALFRGINVTIKTRYSINEKFVVDGVVSATLRKSYTLRNEKEEPVPYTTPMNYSFSLMPTYTINRKKNMQVAFFLGGYGRDVLYSAFQNEVLSPYTKFDAGIKFVCGSYEAGLGIKNIRNDEYEDLPGYYAPLRHFVFFIVVSGM